MSRPVKLRVSYRDDTAFLLRLEAAILKDVRQSVEWRNKIAGQARKLALELLDKEQPSVAASPATESQKRR
jgi:rhodanese-related sulfurtransferase